jgi:four helix bundle protein
MAYLDHENLDVYHVAIELLPEAVRIADEFPRGYSWLADQLRRAATSICLNIAEGAGEFSGKEKARFYRMAKRSATESAAILDAWRALGSPVEQVDQLSSARDRIVRIVSMLVRMVQRVEHGHGVGHGHGHGHAHARERESETERANSA